MTRVRSQMTGAALAALLTLVAPSAAATSKQNVTVVNPPGKPVNTRVTNTVLTVDAENPDRSPFSSRLCQRGEATTACDEVPTSITAPPDRDIVIDTLSGECSIANDGYMRSLNASIDPGTGVFEQAHHFYPQYVSPPGSSHTGYRFHFQTRLHIPANGRLVLSASAPAFNGTYLAFCYFFVNGYTVIP